MKKIAVGVEKKKEGWKEESRYDLGADIFGIYNKYKRKIIQR